MSEPGTDKERREATVVPVRRAQPEAALGVPAAGRRWSVVGLSIVALGLAAALILVFAYLPERVEQSASARAPATAPEVAEEPAEPAEPELTPAEREALREEAEALLAQLLEQRDELEERSAESWGDELWESYETAARLADDAFIAEDLPTAVTQYELAIGHGEALFARSEELMDSALAAGQDALAAGNPDLALGQFEFVLTVDPGNAAALTGRERARALPDVLTAMRRGDERRLEGDLEAAAAAYREALAIDRNWEPARTALDAVTATLAEARFNRLISNGYTALDEGRFDRAAEIFGEAASMRPDSEAARDGLAQAQEGRVLNSIVMAEVRGKAFERRELWDEAMARYREALAVDPTLTFAIEGLERAQYRADLEAKLNALIDSPRLLLNEEVLHDARLVLDEARRIEDTGPTHASLVERLGELVEVASTPINVTLVSDNATQVSVYRVGELGTFTRRELRLTPGRYTAIGARRGYRDVRQSFTVLPGRDNGPVTVICEEPI